MATPTERALQAARARWGPSWSPNAAASAPGRLELLGNHTDYNGGRAIVAAIDRRAVVLVGPGAGPGQVDAVFADTADPPATILIDDGLAAWRNTAGRPQPADYVRGALAVAADRGESLPVGGATIALASDVPIGYGVSSSAAICVALTLALTGHDLSFQDLVLRAQEAEHRAGTPCGTMDQSASIAGMVARFDGASLTVERIEPDLGEHVFALVDSGVARSLGTSSYPIRVRECAEALAIAREVLAPPPVSLAAITPAQVELLAAGTNPALAPELLKRVRHIVTECGRVEAAGSPMLAGDWAGFGALMTASGRSSALDYQISHPEVERIVDAAHGVDGVLGARMMGGGEGGAVLVLLRESAVEPLNLHIDERMGRHCEVQVVRFGAGAVRDQ